ncbi:CDP-alcohol phosphatidyltransferase family protein [Parasphingopyxis marina]|uniref:CDP-alcohol phosphatidyltransferase family protein n=1 Tax=Parasphingopyxis marina TaxID=2761622 RepID=A0A842HV28_9SPHN|nr:CDP-alcohol phosphatidyltransferase family protein [Parasphingopyxis marina]MBC2777858.1 CDP-alcohol phosphatidyltransferase family protein [Parasphingopyxis marina]
MKRVRPKRVRRGLPLRAIIPNAITVLALCMGLSAVRFALAGRWETAVTFIVIAGVLDGFDGRIARLLNGATRFGAELDSLSDVIAFGVSPGLIVYLWSLQTMPRYGWIFALAFAAACALRLARFNAQIDVDEQPHKSAGFLTGVPAPTGAGLLLLPIFLWLVTEQPILREFYIVAPWTGFIAFLLVSNIATFSWSSIRLRRGVRFGALAAIAGMIAAVVTIPWIAFSALAIAYLASMPVSIFNYAKVRRRRAQTAQEAAPRDG